MEDKKIEIQQTSDWDDRAHTMYKVLKTINITSPRIGEPVSEKEVNALIKLEVNVEIIGK